VSVNAPGNLGAFLFLVVWTAPQSLEGRRIITRTAKKSGNQCGGEQIPERGRYLAGSRYYLTLNLRL
jgi:hypothetical protein